MKNSYMGNLNKNLSDQFAKHQTEVDKETRWNVPSSWDNKRNNIHRTSVPQGNTYRNLLFLELGLDKSDYQM